MSLSLELVGEVNHTTEYVTDLFSFDDVEWIILPNFLSWFLLRSQII